MSYFSRPTVTELNAVSQIAAAYAALGKEPPNRTSDTLRRIATEPGVIEAAREVATRAHLADDPEAFMAEALAVIGRAQAVDALRLALGKVGPAVNREMVPKAITQAVEDLEPEFARLVRELVKVAGKLDPADPMSLANAVRDDTTKELKVARRLLGVLGSMSGLHALRPDPNVPNAVLRVLSIVELPPCVVEETLPSVYTPVQVANAGDLAGTHAVRALERALMNDEDDALVAVARGEFEGVRFALCTPTQYRERQMNARAAFTRRMVKPASASPMVVKR